MLLPRSYQYPNLSEGADRVGGQLRGDKECPFSGVTKSSRVWRKVPESDAGIVTSTLTLLPPEHFCLEMPAILRLCDSWWAATTRVQKPQVLKSEDGAKVDSDVHKPKLA